jgi:acetoin utilization deacetylase AcuC-like enzyme
VSFHYGHRLLPPRVGRNDIPSNIAGWRATSEEVKRERGSAKPARKARPSRAKIETVKVFYSPAYVAPRYFYETTRKPGWIAASLLQEPISGIEMAVPEPVSQNDLERIHDPAYVEAVRTGRDLSLASSDGFDWDEGIWTMATAMAGGMVQATREALKKGVAGTLSTGMHHAEYHFGKGFCTFNALVLAARIALDEGAPEVLILDFDAHHGGGTHQLIFGQERISHIDLAVSNYDHYVCKQNCTVFYLQGRTYLETVAAALAAAPKAGLVLYNAGMDPYQGCPVGGIPEVTLEVLAERERMVFEWASQNHLPIAFAIAGGYCSQPLPGPISELVKLHRLTLAAAAASAC